MKTKKKIFSNKGFKIKETSKRKIVIIGTGGHTTSLLNIITTPPYQVVAFVDKLKTSKKFNKIRVINDEEAISKYYDCEFIIGIGDNNIREKLFKMYSKKIKRIKFATLIHDSAIISRNVKIGKYCHIKSGTIIGEDGFGFDFDRNKVIDIFEKCIKLKEEFKINEETLDFFKSLKELYKSPDELYKKDDDLSDAEKYLINKDLNDKIKNKESELNNKSDDKPKENTIRTWF